MHSSVLANGLAAIGAVAILGGVGYGSWQLIGGWNDSTEPETIQVTSGTVTRSVALTGVAADNSRTTLAFPSNGTVASIAVNEGDEVTAGQILATLSLQGQDDEVKAAEAALQEAIAAQRELLLGLTEEGRQVLETTVANAQNTLEQTRREQDRAVANARRVLMNSTPTAFPKDPEERTPAPGISGTYECEDSGSYEFTVFRSNAESGFSARVSGLESDTIPISFTQSVPFGSCGLRVSFTENVLYNRTEWVVPLPNTNAPDYTVNRNAYEAALTTRENRIDVAKDQLRLAEQQRDRDVAPSRPEQIDQANARISQAESRLSQARRTLSDTQLVAPADGTITDVDIRIGEVVTGNPIITMARQETAPSIEVRVPEIDITDVEVGQFAAVVFDARSTETYEGKVSRISPLPTIIDGVAYFIATITLKEPPSFLRSGLNADVDIITDEMNDVATIPIAAVSNLSEDPVVRVQTTDGYKTKPVSILLQGTDGYLAIDGIDVDTSIIINR